MSLHGSKTSSFGTVARLGHDSSRFYGSRLYGDVKPNGEVKNYIENEVGAVNVIHCHDSRDMCHLPDSSVHLMITSPPYNVGKQYDEDLSLQEYLELLHGVLRETYRVLVEGGRVCVNIANVGRKPYIPLHAYIINVALDCGFLMRGEIIWNKNASAGQSCAWGSFRSASNPVLRDMHEYILVFSKGSFKRVDKGEDDIGRDEFMQNTKSVWSFNAESAKRVNHPAPFPVELPLRLIKLYSYVGDVILDPFMGSGTTAEAALCTSRRYVGYEINANYVAQAQSRLGLLAGA